MSLIGSYSVAFFVTRSSHVFFLFRHKVNLINIGFCLLGIVTLAALHGFSNAAAAQNNEYAAAMEDLEGFTAGHMAWLIADSVICLVGSTLGIYGAYKFLIWPVAVSLVMYIYNFVVALIGLHLGGILLAGFFAYPHYYFIKEVKAGVMSPTNYPNEVHSCCCV